MSTLSPFQWEKASPYDIKVGTVWYNRWGGTTKRTIIEVSMDIRPQCAIDNKYERRWPGCKYIQDGDPVPRITTVRWFTNWAADRTKPRIRFPHGKRGRPKGDARREWKSGKDYRQKFPHLFVKSNDRSWIDYLPDF